MKIMKRLLVLLFLFLFSISCEDRSVNDPEDLISESELTKKVSTDMTVQSSQSLFYYFSSNISGIVYYVDGVAYNSAQSFLWTEGSTHEISTVSCQMLNGNYYGFSQWTSGSNLSDTITATTSSTIILVFSLSEYSAELINEGYDCDISAHESGVTLRAQLNFGGCGVIEGLDYAWEKRKPDESWESWTSAGDYHTINPDGHTCPEGVPENYMYDVRVKIQAPDSIWYTSNIIYVNFPKNCCY